jgi:hypothetical protein
MGASGALRRVRRSKPPTANMTNATMPNSSAAISAVNHGLVALHTRA